jgi:hypothetical protein
MPTSGSRMTFNRFHRRAVSETETQAIAVQVSGNHNTILPLLARPRQAG